MASLSIIVRVSMFIVHKEAYIQFTTCGAAHWWPWTDIYIQIYNVVCNICFEHYRLFDNRIFAKNIRDYLTNLWRTSSQALFDWHLGSSNHSWAATFMLLCHRYSDPSLVGGKLSEAQWAQKLIPWPGVILVAILPGIALFISSVRIEYFHQPESVKFQKTRSEWWHPDP